MAPCPDVCESFFPPGAGVWVCAPDLHLSPKLLARARKPRLLCCSRGIICFPLLWQSRSPAPDASFRLFFFACFCVCLAAFVALFSFIEGVTLGALPFPEIENLYLPSSPLSGSLRGLYLLI